MGDLTKPWLLLHRGRHSTTTQRLCLAQNPTCRHPVSLCYSPNHLSKGLKNNTLNIKPLSVEKADIIINIINVWLPRPFFIKTKRINLSSVHTESYLGHHEKCPRSLRSLSRLKSGFRIWYNANLITMGVSMGQNAASLWETSLWGLSPWASASTVPNTG